jgi:hypothetical protein
MPRISAKTLSERAEKVNQLILSLSKDLKAEDIKNLCSEITDAIKKLKLDKYKEAKEIIVDKILTCSALVDVPDISSCFITILENLKFTEQERDEIVAPFYENFLAKEKFEFAGLVSRKYGV